FFLYCFRPHLHLHSFPTRRSSDLPLSTTRSSSLRLPTSMVRFRNCCPFWIYTVGLPCSRKLAREGISNTLGCFSTMISQLALMRSEEHTSELQSRFDLVCRLLLEK